MKSFSARWRSRSGRSPALSARHCAGSAHNAASRRISRSTAEQNWTFAGPFGIYDKAQLQRGFKVYKEVCSACHSINLVAFRNLPIRAARLSPKRR